MVGRFHNSLRAFRRKTPLTISDVSFLLERKGVACFTRYERGKVTPPIEILLAYMILLDTPIKDILSIQHNEIGDSLYTRIPKLIDRLEEGEKIAYREKRISYLQSSRDRIKNELYAKKSF